MGLETLKNNPGCTWFPDKGFLHVETSHALIQAAGHLKYNQAKHNKAILFRGQCRIYSGLVPTLFRHDGELINLNAMLSRQLELRNYIAEASTAYAFLRNTPGLAREPLLQHYGFNTPWLDLVDNIWVALWFACFRAIVHPKNARLVHFEKRRLTFSRDEFFAYILLVAAPSQPTPGCPGFFSDEDIELVDLRQAAPSTYLRPHAQHGLLIRRQKLQKKKDGDLGDCIEGILRIRLCDALSWLGDGSLLSVHSLFPPAGYDSGYACLMEQCRDVRQNLGCIQFVSP
jgi:hypothetical protein